MNIKPVNVNVAGTQTSKTVSKRISALENKCEFLRNILQDEPFNSVLRSDLSKCIHELNNLRRIH